MFFIKIRWFFIYGKRFSTIKIDCSTIIQNSWKNCHNFQIRLKKLSYKKNNSHLTDDSHMCYTLDFQTLFVERRHSQCNFKQKKRDRCFGENNNPHYFMCPTTVRMTLKSLALAFRFNIQASVSAFFRFQLSKNLHFLGLKNY